jgi:hypothetical protein
MAGTIIKWWACLKSLQKVGWGMPEDRNVALAEKISIGARALTILFRYK